MWWARPPVGVVRWPVVRVPSRSWVATLNGSSEGGRPAAEGWEAVPRVCDPMSSSAVPDRDHPAARAADHRLLALHRQHQPAAVTGHTKDVRAGNIEQGIGASTPAHARTTCTGSTSGPSSRSTAWSLPILKAPRLHTPANATPPTTRYPHSDPKIRICLVPVTLHWQSG
jgi:hypothetical protein